MAETLFQKCTECGNGSCIKDFLKDNASKNLVGKLGSRCYLCNGQNIIISEEQFREEYE